MLKKLARRGQHEIVKYLVFLDLSVSCNVDWTIIQNELTVLCAI